MAGFWNISIFEIKGASRTMETTQRDLAAQKVGRLKIVLSPSKAGGKSGTRYHVGFPRTLIAMGRLRSE